jgi:hypothetical protein
MLRLRSRSKKTKTPDSTRLASAERKLNLYTQKKRAKIDSKDTSTHDEMEDSGARIQGDVHIKGGTMLPLDLHEDLFQSILSSGNAASLSAVAPICLFQSYLILQPQICRCEYQLRPPFLKFLTTMVIPLKQLVVAEIG